MIHVGRMLSGKDILHFLRKQGWIIALAFVLVTGTAAFYTLGQPNTYRATARIAITPELIQQTLPRQLISYESYFLTNLTFSTEIEILRSRPLAERIALMLAPPDKRSDGDWLEGQARTIQSQISVQRVEGTRLIRIDALAGDPHRAAEVANAAADQYRYLTAETRLDAYRKSQAWLQEQIADLEAKVQLSEQALIDYLKENDLAVASDGLLAAAPTGNALAGGTDVLGVLHSQLISAELERSRLQERYKSRHPRMVAVNREIEIIQKKIAEENARQGSARIEAHQQAMADKEKAIRYDLLRRTAETNKQLYDALISKLKETDITADLAQPNIRIIELAEVPTTPISPNRKRVAIVGATGGLSLGLLLALLVEWLNPRIRTLEEFKLHFPVPVLGSIPRMDSATAEGGSSPALVSAAEPQAIASEAFRTLRTNVKFSHARQDTNTLVITSCVPREGKTTVAVNLATTMALAGKRVVLVDADLRNPTVAKELGLAAAPGLAHLLAGEASGYENVIRQSEAENLSIITAGLVPPNPAELLDSPLFHELIGRLSRDFDQVLVDSPPVLAVTDTSLLASAARNVLLVLDMQQLNRTLIHRTLDQLKSAEARIYGVALNSVESHTQGYYYPGYTQVVAPNPSE